MIQSLLLLLTPLPVYFFRIKGHEYQLITTLQPLYSSKRYYFYFSVSPPFSPSSPYTHSSSVCVLLSKLFCLGGFALQVQISRLYLIIKQFQIYAAPPTAHLLVVSNAANPCASTQFTDKNGFCQVCPTNCLTCASSSVCNSCAPNTYVVTNAAGSLCQPCGSVLQGCLTCLSNVACLACQMRFFNKNGSCLTCSTLVANCANCSADGTTCNQCKYPYILTGNTCVSATIEQIIAGGNPTPVAPLPNTVPTKSDTHPNGTAFTAVIDSNGCNQFQVFAYGKCFKLIPNCQVYQLSGFCQICNTNYLVTIFGDCVGNNTQLKCEDGYWLNQPKNTCVKVSVACDWYYPNNGSCYNCSANYLMAAANCLPKLNCTTRQFYSDGRCVDVNILCATFTQDGVCTACVSGYFLKDGLCTLFVPAVKVNICTFPCLTCFNQKLDYCFSCAFGFQLKNAKFGSCIPVLYT